MPLRDACEHYVFGVDFDGKLIVLTTPGECATGK